MTIPEFQRLLRPVLDIASRNSEFRASDHYAELADQFGLTEPERREMQQGGANTVFANRVSWALVHLGRAGLIEKLRPGWYRITDRGRQTLANVPDDLDQGALAAFPEYKTFRDKAEESQEPGASTRAAITATLAPEETIRRAAIELQVALAQELIDRILAARPVFFEKLIVQLLVAMGFGSGLHTTARAIGRSGDDGLDGVIDQDALGLERVYLQAKRYKRDNAVGPNAIRDFYGALDIARANKGVLITTSNFSRSAQETAERLGKRIVLIDGDQLAALMIRYDVGVRIEDTFHFKKIDEDFFLDE